MKGVVIACPDCGENHYYEWELLKDNLEHMLETGEPRMHEPAFEVREDEYVQWDYGKGYIDALADTGLEPDRRVRHALPVVRDAVRRLLPLLSPLRPLARGGADLPGSTDRGMDEREVAVWSRPGSSPSSPSGAARSPRAPCPRAGP